MRSVQSANIASARWRPKVVMMFDMSFRRPGPDSMRRPQLSTVLEPLKASGRFAGRLVAEL